MCADDILQYSASRFHLQQAIRTLNRLAAEVGLTTNEYKTEFMKFRKGGKLAGSDHLWLNGKEIEYVDKFTYLGMTLWTSGRSFAHHIDDRLHKTILAFPAIRSPQMPDLQPEASTDSSVWDPGHMELSECEGSDKTRIR